MQASSIRGVVDRIAFRWRHLRESIADLRELDQLDPGLAKQVAGELGITLANLRDVVASGAEARPLMQRMMAEYGIDPEKLGRDDPALARDIAFACSRCRSKGRCERELDASAAHEHAGEFCPNAATFEALASTQAVPVG